MTTTFGEFADRHPKITAAFIGIGCIAVLGMVAWGVLVPEEPSATDLACQEEFGEEWTASGWIGGYPPSIQCAGPDGLTGIMKMPEEIREEKGFVLDTDNSTEGT